MPSRIKRTQLTGFLTTLTMALAMVSGFGAMGVAQAADPPSASTAQAPRVRVTTSMGEFVIELMPDRAPLTVANFLRYVREGQYTNTVFHRVIANFVVQGGGHSAANYQLKPVHEPIANESGNGLANKRGTVGLARGTPPHTGDCQFYVNLADNPDLDPLPTRWGYAVFGRVVEGMGVIEKIGVVPTGSLASFKQDAPLQPIVIQKAEVIGEAARAAAKTPAATNPAPASASGSAPVGDAASANGAGSESAPPPADAPPK